MIYCLNCGKGIPDDSKFCTFCGTPTAVVDPKHPNLATTPPHKAVDVSKNYTSRKTVNEFYKDAGFWGALLVLAGFFLPFFSMSGNSLFEAVQANASSDPIVLVWLIFPIAALAVILHNFVPGWPGAFTTVFIILVLLTLILFIYVVSKDPAKYFNTTEASIIIKTAGIGMWATLLGTILLLFHNRHTKVEVHKTKVIDRTL